MFLSHQLSLVFLLIMRYSREYMLGFYYLFTGKHFEEEVSPETQSLLLFIELGAAIPIACMRIAEPLVWYKFKTTCRQICSKLTGRRIERTKKSKMSTLSHYALVTFQTKQTYIDMVFQIIYGLEQFHNSYSTEKLKKAGVDQASADDILQLEDWTQIGDPSQGICKNICCPCTKENDLEIRRLLIDTVNCYDVNKWDLLKTIHKDDLSAISSENDVTAGGAANALSPIVSGSLTPVSQKSPFGTPARNEDSSFSKHSVNS